MEQDARYTVYAWSKMQTCPECGRTMVRDTSTGAVVYTCYCGYQIVGTAHDARISGATLSAAETEEMYRRLILNAAGDRVNQQVRRLCEACGLDYMTQIRVGEREVVVFICKCGASSSSSGA